MEVPQWIIYLQVDFQPLQFYETLLQTHCANSTATKSQYSDQHLVLSTFFLMWNK